MTHNNPNYKDREAIAPYNFVSLPTHRHLPKTPLLNHDRFYDQDDAGSKVYSGQFDCQLTTETPIFIRGMVSAANFEKVDIEKDKEFKNAPDFFSLDNNQNPTIPGSSLRGLFRSLVEIITNSRPAAITDQRAVFRAVDTTSLGLQYRQRVQNEVAKNTFEPKVQAGYMRKVKDDWYIQPAQTINGTTWCRISHKLLDELGSLSEWPPTEVKETCGIENGQHSKNAQTIYVLPGPYEWQDVRGGFLKIKFSRVLRGSARAGAGLRVAALARSGPMDSKRSEAVVFAPDTNTHIDHDWLPLFIQNSENPEQSVELDHLYREQISQRQIGLLGKDGVLCDLQPVFYLVENGKLTFFGHTLMLRLPYQHAPNDLVPNDLRSDEQDDNKIDMAEAIFGYVRQNKQSKNQALAGRVSFSNAKFTQNLAQPFEREITPKILAGPKTTTFQHYLEQHSPDEKEQLVNYDDANTCIRGYKHYWHKGKTAISDVEERDPEKLRHASQYTKIKAVKAGVCFHFTLRFENLREEELGALGWVLRCAADPNRRLKIGMGKPHGLGAIQITSQLSLIDRKARYSKLLDAQGQWETGATPDTTDLLPAAIQYFEQTVANSTEQFTTQAHIRDLLTMLQWPGPPAQRTRYMEIERRDDDGRKINEYRYRPVLPTPSFVVKPIYKSERAPQKRPQQNEEVVTRRLTDAPISSAANPFYTSADTLPESQRDFGQQVSQVIQSLSRADRVTEGEELVVSITRISANDYECSFGEGKKGSGKLPRDERKGLNVGDQIQVKVKRIANSGAAILTIKGLSKK